MNIEETKDAILASGETPEEIAERIKRAKMADSSFAFFRGNANKFYQDFAKYDYNMLKNENMLCWVQGDAHLYNLGFFNKFHPNAKEIRFELNDFDEAFIGSPIHDIVRFTTSITFLLEYLDLEDDKKCSFRKSLVEDKHFENYFLKKYLKYIKEDKFHKIKYKNKFMKYHYKKAKKIILEDFFKKSTLAKMTKEINHHKVFDYDNDLKQLKSRLKNKIIKQLYEIYGHKFKVLDIAKRIGAGVGSANLRRYYALIVNEDNTTSLIEAKEQIKPSIVNSYDIAQKYFNEQFTTYPYANIYVEAVNKMVDNYDTNLEVFNFRGKSYILKSLFNVKYTIDAKKICKKYNVKDNLESYIQNCAKILSNTHKKTALNHQKFLEEVKSLDKSVLLEISDRAYKKELENFEIFQQEHKKSKKR